MFFAHLGYLFRPNWNLPTLYIVIIDALVLGCPLTDGAGGCHEKNSEAVVEVPGAI